MVYVRFRRRLAAVILTFCCVFLNFPAASLSAFADKNQSGSITITCKTEDRILVGMQWELFHVADRNQNYYELMAEYRQQIQEAQTYHATVDQPNVYQTVGQFKGSPVMLNDLSDSAMASAASTLENEAIIKKYKPDRTAYADSSGIVFFDNVPQGLYLLSGKRLQIGDITIITSPMLVEVVQDDYLDDLHIDSIPKLELRTLADGDSQHTVRKIWVNDTGYEIDRDAYITVNVYKNGEYFDTATLNEDNNWEMTWYGETAAEWRVEEVDIPEKYTVIYLANETQFKLENTYNPWYDSSSSNDDWGWGSTTSIIETTATDTAESTGGNGNGTDTATTDQDDSLITDQNSSGSGSTVTTQTTTTAGGSGSGSGYGSGKLPQTGQLWWPVPIMGLGGIVFIMIGWQLLRREERP